MLVVTTTESESDADPATPVATVTNDDDVASTSVAVPADTTSDDAIETHASDADQSFSPSYPDHVKQK